MVSGYYRRTTKNILCFKCFLQNVLSPAQVGFGKDHRTSDSVFALLSLIYKYIKKGK